MYKKLVVLSALLMIGILCDAQSTNVGFSLGANFSNLVGRNRIKDSDPRIGLCPGIHIDIPLAYESWLEISGIYSQQGVRIKTDGYPLKPQERVKTNVTRYVDYLTVPIMWKQSWGDLYTKIGPYAAFAMKATSKMLSDTIRGLEETVHYDSSKDPSPAGQAFNQSFINSLRQYDVGACFGIGYRTPLGKSNVDVFLEAGCKFGFFSVEDKPKTKADALRNQLFSLSAGFYIVSNRRSNNFRRHR